MLDVIEIDHSTTNLPHSLYHIGIMITIALALLGFMLVLAKYGSRLLRHTKDDLKNSGLNYKRRREFRAIERRKLKQKSRTPKKKRFRF